jgi:hypothetical protein
MEKPGQEREREDTDGNMAQVKNTQVMIIEKKRGEKKQIHK